MGRLCLKRLSESHLLHNLSTLKQQAPGAEIIALLKADAYGHGAIGIAQRLEGHVSFFATACLQEALILRRHGIQTPLLLLEGVFSMEEMRLAEKENCHTVVHTLQQLCWLEESHCRLHVWIKVNSGLGRLGFRPEEVPTLYKKITALPMVQKPVRLLSHFACADVLHHPLNQQQKHIMHQLSQCIHGAPISFCNSAALFHFPECHYQYVRPGLALYGISPIQEKTAEDLGLKPVMTLESQLISRQILYPSESIGYSARYVNITEEPIPTGVVSIGYGDGYARSAPLGTPVLIRGKECPILGGVAMDMTMVDLRPCPEACIGDTVLLWGPQLSVERLSSYIGRIPYDLITSLLPRVSAVWE